MSALSEETFAALVDEARLAPTLHNVQPTRFQLRGSTIMLLGETRRAAPVADPSWRDWRLSHGAALEGLAMALARRGFAIGTIDVVPHGGADFKSGLVEVARVRVVAGKTDIGLPDVGRRMSWRGPFRPADAATDAALDAIAAARGDLVVVRTRSAIEDIAALGDRAGLHFLRDHEHRRELLAWMRLAGSHPDYERDGLNARAMALSPIEAWAAGLVLGELFAPLDAVGLVGPLVSESAKTRSAAAVALFHRPAGEDALELGRAFYRAWLAIDAAGLKACPMSVLSDWDVSREMLAARHGVATNRQILNVLRVGVPAGDATARPARLPVSELIVP